MLSSKTRPVVFIGSSTDALEYAKAIKEFVASVAHARIWNENVFELSSYTLSSLQAQMRGCDFAVFVFYPDDPIKKGDKDGAATRDNVVFELGLFAGALGMERVFFVVPNNPVSPLLMPSDLQGLTYGRYDLVSDGKYPEAVKAVCSQIQQSIGKHGPRPRPPSLVSKVVSNVFLAAIIVGFGIYSEHRVSEARQEAALRATSLWEAQRFWSGGDHRTTALHYLSAYEVDEIGAGSRDVTISGDTQHDVFLQRTGVYLLCCEIEKEAKPEGAKEVPVYCAFILDPMTMSDGTVHLNWATMAPDKLKQDIDIYGDIQGRQMRLRMQSKSAPYHVKVTWYRLEKRLKKT